ncbi:MAG: PhnD/SsuA/transferrin family substrate-binding protein [Candidatus Sedimenticola sp. (ex Thyasira tokunagai)]
MKLPLVSLALRTALAILLAWGPVSLSTADSASPQKVRIGVLAKRGEQVARVKWQAMADYLTATSSKRQFEIVPLDFDEIPPVVHNGLIDFVIVNSAIYVDLSVHYGARRILTMKNRVANNQSSSMFGSVVFVRADNKKVNSWQDLNGKRLAAVHETSLGGWILGRYAIEKGGGDIGDLDLLTFSGTHDQVVKDVLAGKVDAGIVRTDTLERMAEESQLDLAAIRVLNRRSREGFPLLLSSELVPEWPISELKHVTDELSREVALALLQMKEADQAAVNAKISGWSIPQNYQKVHDILKAMDLPPYDRDSEVSLLSVLQRYWYWILILLVVLITQSALIANVVRLNRRLHRQRESMVESEEQFRSLFQQVAVGFVFATPTGAIIKANHRLSQISGYSEVELRRINVTDLLHAENLPAVTARFELMRRGDTSQFMVQTQIKSRHGGSTWVQLTLSAVRDEKLNIKYLVGVFDDIADLKALEHELKAEKSQKSLILDIAGDGIFGLDKEGKHSFVNPAAASLLGYEVEELIGHDSHSTWHHSHPDGSPFPVSECPITAALLSGVVHRGTDELFWRKDGSSIASEYVSTPIFEGDQITGAVVVFREHVKATDGRQELDH